MGGTLPQLVAKQDEGGKGMIRRAAKKDDNQRAVEQAFKFHGFKVFDLSRIGEGWPDLMVSRLKSHAFVEVKGEKGRLTPAQVRFLAENGNQLPIYFAQTDADVVEICQHVRGAS